MSASWPPRRHLGHGAGIRVPHFDHALARGLAVDVVEVLSENYLAGGGRPAAVLERLRRDMPVVCHGVSLGLGSPDPPAAAHLARLRALFERIEPAWVGDHLCWGGFGGHHSHDLLPLPFTEAAISRLVDHIGRVQDALRRQLVLENVSSYVGFTASAMPEWEFVREVIERADALMLLDVNNVIVSAANFGFDPITYVEALPSDRIVQLHLANHSDRGHYKFDSHAGAVPAEVWSLYDHVARVHGPITTIVEWDEDIGDVEDLLAQRRIAVARERAIFGAEVGPWTN